MTKRIFALILCLVICVGSLAGCGKGSLAGRSKGKIDPIAEDKGQQIIMYLTENVYDLDPIHAYYNESTRAIVSLLFDTLFTIDENGKVRNSLAKEYTIEEDPNADEYYMHIVLKETNWSDNTPITADDVVFAWKRVLSYKDSYDAAALLFDIKNARAYNEGEVSKDDIGLTADGDTVTIQFEGPIDYDQFILNLTSLALAPLREDKVGGAKGEDWAKKPGTMVVSGPFKLARISFAENSAVRYKDINYDEAAKAGNKTVYIDATTEKSFKEQIVTNFVLERNSYYYRNSDKDENLDVSVLPYRIIVDCAMSDEDIAEAYDNGTILYMGDIPVSLRSTYKDEATVKDSLSTSILYFNQNAVIEDGSRNGSEIFAIKEVRQALSMAIDREAIANMLVFADVATGIVPTGVYDSNSAKKLFRDSANGDYKYLTKNLDEALKLLESVDIDPEDCSFFLTVAAYDEAHILIAEAIVEAWCELGFDVDIKLRGTIANNDYYKYTESVPSDICDDTYAEDLRSGKFEVILLDLVAISVDPFSVLAPFAKGFSGQGMDMSTANNYKLTPHVTGYDSEEYNALMEEIFAEKTIENRTTKLHEAENILMEDMPVAPIVFNKTAILVNDGLKAKVKTAATNYYTANTLQRIQVKDFDEYVIVCANFIESKFDEYKENPLSYFGNDTYSVMSFEEFKEESSNYGYFLRKKSAAN